MGEFSHLDEHGNPKMVDVGAKAITERTAIATSAIRLPDEVLNLFDNNDVQTKKGPVFQTAIIAGIMAAKRTSELIPLCHPLALNKCDVDIRLDGNVARISCTVSSSGKTGVEMEALTGASVAGLTIYDMCKAFGHDMVIEQTQLVRKTGGKSDFEKAQ